MSTGNVKTMENPLTAGARGYQNGVEELSHGIEPGT